MLLLLLLCPTTHAESIEDVVDDLALAGWQETAQEAGWTLDVRKLIVTLCTQPEQADWQGLINQLTGRLKSTLSILPTTLVYLVCPALLCALNRRFLNGDLSQAAQLVCFLGEAQILLALFAAELSSARAAIQRIGQLTEQVYPVLLSLLSLTGGSAAVGLMRPLYAFLSGMFSTLIHRVAFLLTSCAAALSIAGHLSPNLRLNRLFRLLRSVCGYLVGGCMTAFLAILSLGGLLGAARDGVSIRAAKYAVDHLLPVVGGEVAGAMDAVVMSASLVKNAAGVTGLMLLIGVCLEPLTRLIGCMLCCRLAAALIEPLDAGEVSACLEDFSGVLQMLLIALCASIVLFVILVGATIWAGSLVFALR